MRTWFFVAIAVVAALMLWGGDRDVSEPKDNADEDIVENERISGYGTGNVTQGSWLELFLGMGQIEVDNGEDGPCYRYVCQVPEFEGRDDIASQELEATWYGKGYDEPVKYHCTLGLYVDKDFPSDKVFRQVELGIDTLLTHSFYYNEELEDLKETLALREGYHPQTTQDILNRTKQVFELYTVNNGSLKSSSDCFEYPESRVCIVAHKIYDKDDWVSYIIEFSFSYNGSNGCPSWADYISVNEKTGERLTTEDIIKKYGEANISKKLRKAYETGKAQRNFDLEVNNYTGQELIDLADGCAIVNEGVMFYYRPYNVGCGAEGEFNLVLDYDWK